jgi:hypothetical protein
MVVVSAASIATSQPTVTATGSDMPAAAADQQAIRLEQARGVQAQHAAQQLLCVLQLCHGPNEPQFSCLRTVQVLGSTYGPYAFISTPIGLLPGCTAAAAAEAHSNASNELPNMIITGIRQPYECFRAQRLNEL